MKVFVSIPKDSHVMKTFIPMDVCQYMEQRVQVVYSPLARQVTKEDILTYAADCDAIITGWGHPQISYDMIRTTNIKLIAHTGGSVGSLVTPDVYDNDVKVISGNLMYAESVAEGVIAYMLMALRKLPEYVSCTRSGEWSIENGQTKGLLDRSVGLIGQGAISTFLAEKLRVFNVKVKMYSGHPIKDNLVHDFGVEQVSLEEALQCNVVSLHSAMNERTRGMIGTEQFKLIRDGALFLNTARGHIVDEEAMIEELKKNRFTAVLDVYYNEPLEIGSPLRYLPNVYCIPHLAGPTFDRRPVITKRLVDNIKLFENGQKMPLEISKEHHARMTIGG